MAFGQWVSLETALRPFCKGDLTAQNLWGLSIQGGPLGILGYFFEEWD